MKEEARVLEVEIIAATHYDYRPIGSSRGVTLYCRHPHSGEIRCGNAPLENWYSLSHEAPKAFETSTMQATDIGTTISNVSFEEPYPKMQLVEDDWSRFLPT